MNTFLQNIVNGFGLGVGLALASVVLHAIFHIGIMG